jgi:hypothetical protein
LDRVGGDTRSAALPDGRIVIIRTGLDGAWLDVLRPDGTVVLEGPVFPPRDLKDPSLVAIGPTSLLVIDPEDTCSEDAGCNPSGILAIYGLDLGPV